LLLGNQPVKAGLEEEVSILALSQAIAGMAVEGAIIYATGFERERRIDQAI
jgi:hypothetical protein